MIENIRLSFQGIWSHKMRSFLTMLGIIIGIAAIIAIVSTIKGTNEQIKQNLVGSGGNTVEVQLYQGTWTYEIEYNGIPAGVGVITQDILDKIKADESVSNAALYNVRNGSVYYNDVVLSYGKIIGTDSAYFATCGYVLQDGRLFADRDNNSSKVAIVDSIAAKTLFASDDPVGKIVEIGNEAFTVVGVVDKSDDFEPTIESLNDYYTYVNDDATGTVFIPSGTWPVVYNFDEPQNMVVKAVSTEDMTAAGKIAEDTLNDSINPVDSTIKYKAEDLLEQAKELQRLSASTNQQLIWIASISLLVGGIGVMNIMLVSVTERTKEIGLKKAIGAKKSRILGQFLTEAAVLTSFGGLIGVLAGIILANIVSKISDMPVGISVPAIVISVVFSMVIGVVFGLLPSIKAANLNPIEALRHE